MSDKRKRAHYAVDKLSAAGKQLVDDMLVANATYEAIVTELKTQNGEKLSLSALQRYSAKMRSAEQSADQKSREFSRLELLARESLNLNHEILKTCQEIRGTLRETRKEG